MVKIPRKFSVFRVKRRGLVQTRARHSSVPLEWMSTRLTALSGCPKLIESIINLGVIFLQSLASSY